METEIAVIFCSKKTGEEIKPFIEHLKETSEANTHVYYIHNPDGISLSKIYADMLESNDIKENVVIFIHDDIEFLRKGWGKEILRLFNEHQDYGIIGVAGSAQFDENGAWWNYEKKFGQVLHRSEGKSWLTAFSPLLDKDLQEVVVIDGLFIATHKKRVSSNFDRTLAGFDFYDISFCLQNYFDNKCKIGVTTNIRIAHNSVGALKQTWYENRKIINDRWGDKFPIDILKNK
jgi:hypothetical protein